MLGRNSQLYIDWTISLLLLTEHPVSIIINIMNPINYQDLRNLFLKGGFSQEELNRDGEMIMSIFAGYVIDEYMSALPLDERNKILAVSDVDTEDGKKTLARKIDTHMQENVKAGNFRPTRSLAEITQKVRSYYLTTHAGSNV